MRLTITINREPPLKGYEFIKVMDFVMTRMIAEGDYATAMNAQLPISDDITDQALDIANEEPTKIGRYTFNPK